MTPQTLRLTPRNDEPVSPLMPHVKRLLTSEDVQALIGADCSPASAIHIIRAAGGLKLGKRYVVHPDALDRYMKEEFKL